MGRLVRAWLRRPPWLPLRLRSEALGLCERRSGRRRSPCLRRLLWSTPARLRRVWSCRSGAVAEPGARWLSRIGARGRLREVRPRRRRGKGMPRPLWRKRLGIAMRIGLLRRSRSGLHAGLAVILRRHSMLRAASSLRARRWAKSLRRAGAAGVKRALAEGIVGKRLGRVVSARRVARPTSRPRSMSLAHRLRRRRTTALSSQVTRDTGVPHHRARAGRRRCGRGYLLCPAINAVHGGVGQIILTLDTMFHGVTPARGWASIGLA